MALGFDLGGTHLRAAVVADDGALIAKRRVELGDTAVGSVVGGMAQLRRELMGDDRALAVAPVGVGVAAQLWTREGRIAVAPNLGWHDVPLRDLLQRELGVKVRLVNDLNAIAWAEARAAGADNVMCVFVGTGVGMGAVCQGVLIEGADGLATELGHIKTASTRTGRLCGCGERGCLEAYTGGAHLGPRLQELAASASREPADAAGIERLVAAGDRAATALWADVAARLAVGIGAAIALFNPHVLVLGGGVFAHAPRLEQRVRKEIDSVGPRSHMRGLRIIQSHFGDDAGAVGAALLSAT